MGKQASLGGPFSGEQKWKIIDDDPHWLSLGSMYNNTVGAAASEYVPLADE